jgi:hypothetical protein
LRRHRSFTSPGARPRTESGNRPSLSMARASCTSSMRIGKRAYLANAGDWAQQVVYDATRVAGSSMRMSANGELHVSFTAGGGDAVGSHLMYATNATGNWVTETIDSASEIGWVTSVAIDKLARPHISYYDATHGNLRHAVKVRAVIDHPR